VVNCQVGQRDIASTVVSAAVSTVVLAVLYGERSGRSERYRHDTHEDNADSDDDGEDSMFHSFSSCSPRYSQDHIRVDRVRRSLRFSSSIMSSSGSCLLANDNNVRIKLKLSTCTL